MCTAAEAKTLQRVYGRYNSFFRKVIPAKRVQKPVRWYTRLTVYGNPGRVVNGCAPGIARLFEASEMGFEVARRVFRKRPQGVSPDALRSEARKSGASGCGGCPCRSGGRV